MTEHQEKRLARDRATLFVTGNVQAAAIAQVLQNLPPVVERFTVEQFDSSEDLPKSVPKGSLWLEQVDANGTLSGALPMGVTKRVSFPSLELHLLWPFNSVNPSNKPAPPDFPFGRFPYGDSFIQSCIAQGVSRSDILRVYLSNAWSPTWPDLDRLFRKESERLSALDSTFKLGIGGYILKHFRLERLFLTPQSPTDLLLAELTTRLLAVAFPGDSSMASANAPGVISSLGPRDCLGLLAIPIHPLVARHFQLTWITPNSRFNYFNRAQLTDREYYGRFLDDALGDGAGHGGTPERIVSGK